LTTLSLNAINRQISDSLAVLPERSHEMSMELVNITDSVQLTMLGSLAALLEKKKMKGDVRSLRRDKDYKAMVSRILDNLKERVTKKIKRMQLRSYKEGLRSIASAWNQNTPNGILFDVTVSKAELKAIYERLIGGLTLEDWLDDSLAKLRRKLLSAAGTYVIEPTGDEDGKVLLNRKIRRGLDSFTRESKGIASQAINVANSVAYEDAIELFSDESKWLYR